MDLQDTSMNKRGPNKKATPEDIIRLMKNRDRPVWTAASLADELEVTRPTIQDRLNTVKEHPRTQTMQVANSTAYYLTDEDPRPLEEQIRDSIIEAFTDEFVGLYTAPWTAVHPNDRPAEGGDRVQLYVEGNQGNWRRSRSRSTRHYDNRRKALPEGAMVERETQALISGELYEKPTVPIEHVEYPDNYELESKIGLRWAGDPPNQALVAVGEKKYLIRPCDDAVFLKNVEVDHLSPPNEGEEGVIVGPLARDQEHKVDDIAGLPEEVREAIKEQTEDT